MEQQEANQTADPVVYQVTTTQMRENLVEALKSTGSTFNWIGGLSLVNTILVLSNAGIMMLGGLGITLVVDYLFLNSGSQLQPVGWGINITIALMFFALARFAGKGSKAAFLFGTVLYALDGALYVMIGDWVNVAFHAYFLWLLFRGFQACGVIKQAIAELDEQRAQTV